MTTSLKGIPAGTLLLECIYCINCVAPKSLQVERFLPLTPIRLLVDSRGKDLAEIMPHARLNELCEKVKKPVALQIIKQVHSQVEEKMKHASSLADALRAETLVAAEARMREELGAEQARLEALRAINPHHYHQPPSLLSTPPAPGPAPDRFRLASLLITPLEIG